MAKLVDDEKWAPLIGRLFLNFGSIEMIVQNCIKEWTNNIIYEHIKKDNLSKRISLTIELVQSLDYSEINKNSLIASFKSVQKLLEVRNTIAHSPLMLIIFQESSDIIEAIGSSTNSNHYIEFHALEEHVENAEKLYDEIIGALAKFKMEKFDLTKYENMKGIK